VKWFYGGAHIPPVDVAAENQLLDGWSQAMGTASPVCVVNGSLVDVREASWINFRKGPFDNDVVSGFYPWEKAFRWMGRSGTVRLQGSGGDSLVIRAQVPLNLLQKKWSNIRGLRARVHADSTPVGEIFISHPEEEFRLPLPNEIRAKIAPGHGIEVTLESELVWRGVDVNIPDDRELSLALVAIGFSPPEEGTATSPSSCSARFAKEETDHQAGKTE